MGYGTWTFLVGMLLLSASTTLSLISIRESIENREQSPLSLQKSDIEQDYEKLYVILRRYERVTMRSKILLNDLLHNPQIIQEARSKFRELAWSHRRKTHRFQITRLESPNALNHNPHRIG